MYNMRMGKFMKMTQYSFLHVAHCGTLYHHLPDVFGSRPLFLSSCTKPIFHKNGSAAHADTWGVLGAGKFQGLRKHQVHLASVDSCHSAGHGLLCTQWRERPRIGCFTSPKSPLKWRHKWDMPKSAIAPWNKSISSYKSRAFTALHLQTFTG